MERITVIIETVDGEVSVSGPLARVRGKVVGLELLDCGGRRIAVIKEIRRFLGVGLKVAKDISETLPYDLSKFALSPYTLDEFAAALEGEGAVVARTYNEVNGLLGDLLGVVNAYVQRG